MPEYDYRVTLTLTVEVFSMTGIQEAITQAKDNIKELPEKYLENAVIEQVTRLRERD